MRHRPLIMLLALALSLSACAAATPTKPPPTPVPTATAAPVPGQVVPVYTEFEITEAVSVITSAGAWAVFTLLDEGTMSPLDGVVNAALSEGGEVYMVLIPDIHVKTAVITDVKVAEQVPSPGYGYVFGLFDPTTTPVNQAITALELSGYKVIYAP